MPNQSPSAPGNGKPPTPQLTEETLKQFLDLQMRELENQSRESENRRHELRIQEKEQDNGFVYAEKVLEAEKDDRKDRRSHGRKQMIIRFSVALAALIVLSVIAIWSLEKNQPDIAKEIIKAMMYMVPSFLGGYGARLLAEKSQAGPNVQPPQQ